MYQLKIISLSNYVKKRFDVPICVILGFMQIEQLLQQTQNSDTFYQPSVPNAHCIKGSER